MVPVFPQQRVVQAGHQAMRVGCLATILPAGAEGDAEDLRAEETNPRRSFQSDSSSQIQCTSTLNSR